MLASEAGKHLVVKDLLCYNFIVNLSVDGKTAADLAFENGRQNALYVLLNANALYPSKYNDEKSSIDVRSFTQQTTYFFKCIGGGFEKEIIAFLEENSHLRYIYNTKNKSAINHAIKLKKFDILKILLEFNVSIAPHEKLSEMTQGFTNLELSTLKGIFDKYKGKYRNKDSESLEFVAFEKIGDTAHLEDNSIEMHYNTSDSNYDEEEVYEDAFAKSFINEENLESLRKVDVESEDAKGKNI